MFKRKLFKRALPVILSVAMIFQSMPATALAAENEMTEVVETTVEDSGSESDAGDEAKEPANEEPEAPAAEQPEASAPAEETKQEEADTPATTTVPEEVSASTEEPKQEETSAPAESTTQEETSAPVETTAPETTTAEEEATDEELQQAEADEVAAAKIIVDEQGLKNAANQYALSYEDGVISGSYNPDTKIFDNLVNNTLKDVDKSVISIKVGDKTDDDLSKNLKDKLSFQWNRVEKQEGADDKLTALPAGDTPKDAGTYRLVLSLDAVDGVCGKAENVGIDFEIKQVVLKAAADEKPEIGTKLADFVNSVKENFTLSEIDNNNTKIVKDVFVKDAAVSIKDAITGADIEITDAAVFEKGRDYSYTLTITLNDDYAKNYVVEDFGNIVIEVQGDVPTKMEITPLKNIEYTYSGKAIEFPVAGTDYAVKVTYKDEETEEDVAIENPVITPSWLDADGKELEEAPVDAGSYQVLLTYSDTTGRYAVCEKAIAIKINPVSIYLQHSLSKTEYADQTKEADVLKNVKYEAKKQADDTAVALNDTFWGVSYNDEQKTQPYEPVFEVQVAKLSLKDGKPEKDETGNPVYGAWSDNSGKALDGSKIDGVNQYKYRVVFSGKKGVRWSGGMLTGKVDINDRGTNSAENNYSVDVSEKLRGEKAVDITVAEAATVTIDVSAYEGKTEKIYDGKPFEGYETRSGYKKAKVPSGELTYEWYESIETKTTLDSEGKEQIEYVWSDEPVYDWNITYPEPYGTETTFSPVNAGVYKLLISYNDPTGANTARDAEVIHIIHRQKVKAEIATGTEAQEFVTYSGVGVSDFKAKIEETLVKAVKPAKENNLNELGEALEWEYGEYKDYSLEWFIQRKDNLTEGKWIDVGDDEEFYEGDEYALSVGVKINPSTKNPDNLYDDNYQSYDRTADGVEYYKSNVIPIKVEKMGTTPINIVIDNTKITQTTRPYNGEALAIPTDAVAVYDDKTGALVTDIQLTYVWKNKKGTEFDNAVNADVYKLYVGFEGNANYAPLKEPELFETQFEITPLEIGFQPVLNSQINAGYSAIEENVANSMELVIIDPIPESEIEDFTREYWINEAGVVQSGYKAIKDFNITIKTADGKSVPYDVLKSNTSYYAEVSSVEFSSPYPYAQNYKPVYLKTDFTAERVAGYVGKAGYGDVPATSLEDTVDGLSHTIMPREGVAYTSKAITTEDGKTLSGNFFVFAIQAPLEFYQNGSSKSQYVGESPVFENSLKDAKGYYLSYTNGKIIVAFEVTEETKTKQQSFQVRWEDGFVEEYTVDFTNAVLEADLRKAVAPKSIAFNNPAKKMVIGEKQQLDVKVTKKQLDDIICLRYETDNEDVLSVSDSGAVVAIQAGSANVKAIPCYLDNDGKKVDITGAKAATAKITVVDVTAPKIKGVAVRDTWATVTYPALTDGYRREIYVVEAASKVTADQIESQISNIVNGDWRSAGFACAPIYTASENIDSKNIAGVDILGLKANTAYVVYVRNVSGVRTLSNGKTVALSYKGAVKNFKTTLAEVQDLAIEFEEKYEDAYEYNVWRASLSEKKIPTVTNGCFPESATNPSANADDLIWHVLPFAKGSDQAKYCAQPKLSYYVTESDYYTTEPTGLYTLKIGENYYQPTKLAKVDKKGTVTLSGVGTVYVWVYDAVTGAYDYAKLYITAEPTKFTLAKNAKVKVGSSIRLGDYATYYDEANKKVPGDVKATLAIEDISGDKDSFVLSTAGIKYDPVLDVKYYDTYITAKEANKNITLKVKVGFLESRAAGSSEATITITSSAIDSVKNLKVSDIVDRFATYSFTYPASALRLWDRGYYDEDGELWISDTSDTESVAQLYFRVRVLDAAKKVVSDTYINPYIANEYSAREYNAKTKTYTFKGKLKDLNRKSSYTMSVTAVYLGQTQDQTSKPVSKGFKTTDIPAAYPYEYGGSFPALTDKDYKTADGGIEIGVGNGNTILREYPALTSNNTYTLIACPQNPEAKNRLTDTLTWKSTNTKVATVKANAGSYTATLKALRKGTTQIEVTSKVTKRIIARWTVYVNATGEATYYYGDWEPDEDINIANGIEYGDLELLTIDNQVQATLAAGEGKIAKFVAPAYGEYTIQSSGLAMMVYAYNQSNEKWESLPLRSTWTDELHENEVRYVVVKNLGSEKPAKIKIWAEGTTYSTLTMDGFKKTDSKEMTMAFTAPEDNVYTFTRDNKTTITTLSLKANETGKVQLPSGIYEVSVSKREPVAIDLSGKEKETIGAGATKWYVFEAPSAQEYTFAATNGTLKVYSAIDEEKEENNKTLFLEAGEKVYISVKNGSAKDITSDITIKPAAQILNVTDDTKPATVKVENMEANKPYYVQLIIPKDGLYRIKTTGSVAEAAAKAEPELDVRLTESTTVSGEWIGTSRERKFNKGDIRFVSISSDTANTTAELTVTYVDPVSLPVEKVSVGSDYSYFKYTAKTDGAYVVKAENADVSMEMSDNEPSQSQSWRDLGDSISVTAGDTKYFRARSVKNEAVETKITAAKIEAEEFTDKKEVKLAKDETKWLHFTATEDTLYSFTRTIKQTVEGTGSVNVFIGDTLESFTYIGTNVAPNQNPYKAGKGFYLKLTANDGEVTYTIEARPVKPENVTNSEFTLGKSEEKWFKFTAPVTAKYSVKLTGDTNVFVGQHDITNGSLIKFIGSMGEITLDAGKTAYFKVTNQNTDAEKKVTLTIEQVTFTALDVNEGGKNSDKATLTAGDSVWYSFTAPKGGRYSFNVTAADNAYADLEYYSEKYESKTGVGNPENAVLLKAKETVLVKVTLQSANAETNTAEVTTSVKAIDPKDITAAAADKPIEETVTDVANGSYNWYMLQGEGTYTVTISDVTEGGSFEAKYVKNTSTYFDPIYGNSTTFSLGKDDVYTIAVRVAGLEKLGYKVKVEKRDVKELSLGEAGSISASLKNTETLHVSFKIPENGRYAVRLEGLDEKTSATISSPIYGINNNNYFTFYGVKGNTVTMQIRVNSAESVSFKVVAEAVTTTDISASGSATIDISKTPAGYMSWYAYTASESGKHIVKVSDVGATVYWYGKDDTLNSGSAISEKEQYLNKGETYYCAVYYSGKPDANVEFSIAPVTVNTIPEIKEGETSASLTVETAKVAPNEKYYYSFTAPEDGRYTFSFETESAYSFTTYKYWKNNINNGYENYYDTKTFEIPVAKAQTVTFSTSYAGMSDKDYTIKVEKIVPTALAEAGKDESITIAPDSLKYISVTTDNTSEVTVRISPVESEDGSLTSVNYEIYNNIQDKYYSTFGTASSDNARTYTWTIPAGETRFVKLINTSSVEIKVNMQYTTGEELTAVNLNENKVDVKAGSKKVVYFTSTEDAVYKFTHSGNAQYINFKLNNYIYDGWYTNNSCSNVYIGKGDTVFFTLEAGSSDISDTVTIIETNQVNALELGNQAMLTVNDTDYAYIKVSAEKTGSYLLSLDNYATLYRMSGNGLDWEDWEYIGNDTKIVMQIEAGDTSVYRLYSYNQSSITATLSYMGSDVVLPLYDELDLTVNKGEYKYIDLRALIEYDEYNDLYNLYVSADKNVNVQYLRAFSAEPENVGAGKDTHFMKRLDSRSFIKITGTADNTTVKVSANGVEEQIDWYEGGIDAYLQPDVSYNSYILCSMSAYYYFTFEYASRIEIIDSKGNVLKNIPHDQQGMASAERLNGDDYYIIRVYNESKVDANDWIGVHSYNQTTISNVPFNTWVNGWLDQYYIDFTAPSDGTYAFGVRGEESYAYASLYDAEGNILVLDVYNGIIQWDLKEGDQVRLMTWPEDHESGGYQVSINKIDITEAKQVPFKQQVYASAGDLMWFEFTAPEAGTYVFYSSYYSDNEQLDTRAWLYDEQGNMLAEDDDGQGDSNFIITKSLLKGEQVRLMTRLYDTSLSGNYYVHIEKQK